MTGQRRGQRPYVSTTCLQSVGYRETVERYEDAGIDRIELGYCPSTEIDLAAVMRNANFDAVAHNYFRPVNEEFVLNLASQDESIRRRSVEYIRDGLNFCSRHGIDSYTFHAGFRVDPDTSFRFDAKAVPDIDTCIETFVESLRTLRLYAEELGIDIAIENNVATDKHMIDGTPVVLLAGPDEFETLIDRVDIGVLLDTGHLNVAAETIGFDRDRFIEVVDQSLAGFHVHTNDGTADNHDPVDEDDWAFELCSRYQVPTTIEAHVDDIGITKEQLRTFKE